MINLLYCFIALFYISNVKAEIKSVTVNVKVLEINKSNSIVFYNGKKIRVPNSVIVTNKPILKGKNYNLRVGVNGFKKLIGPIDGKAVAPR